VRGRGRLRPRLRGGPHPAFARSRLRHALDWILVVLLFGACALIVTRLDEVSLQRQAGQARVVDGDTLALDGRRIRLRGIDAFERDQTCLRAGSDYACGAEATRALGSLVASASVECTGRTVDRYGRLLAVCIAVGRDLNAAMVQAGWAVSYGAYAAEEQAARAARRGGWAGDFVLPADWREGRGEPYEPPQDWLRQAIDLILQLLGGRRGDST
jgi:endonuclease YncB( thermonuclease family)